MRGGDRARLARPSHPISRHGRSGRASLITAVSMDRILDEPSCSSPCATSWTAGSGPGPAPTNLLESDWQIEVRRVAFASSVAKDEHV
jgi:hypothetical protein